jgi:hypothetical protein
MSKSTISVYKLFEIFPDQEAARKYLEGRLWPNGVRCPACQTGENVTYPQERFLSLQSLPTRFHG